MTPERLLELVKGGECLEIEFKGEKNKRLSDDEIVEAVVCLANRSGTGAGWLLVGVEDDGKITGAPSPRSRPHRPLEARRAHRQ